MKEYRCAGEIINEMITEIVKFNKMTKASYAHKLGVTPTALSRWTNGHSIPRKKIYDKIVKEYSDIYAIKVLG